MLFFYLPHLAGHTLMRHIVFVKAGGSLRRVGHTVQKGDDVDRGSREVACNVM